MYKLRQDGIQRLADGALIPLDEGNRDYQTYLAWLAEGNTPDPEFSEAELAEQAKQAAVDAVIATFEVAIAQPVECIVNGATYSMDGRQQDAESMKHGIELAELTGATTMDIVDYYNQVHEAVLLEDCYAIMLQQAAAYLANWAKKSKDRAAILAAG